MPKVSQAHLDSRRRQILAAAVTCFARAGFHRTSMQDIVTQSKLSPGAIYNYFDSKEAIIAAIAAERHAREQAFLAEARNAADIAEALKQIRDFFFGDLRNPQERQRRRVNIQLWAEAQRDPKIRKLVRRGMDQPLALLRSLIAKAQRRREISAKLDADAVARLMIASFHGFVLQADWDDRVATDPYRRVLDDLLRNWLLRRRPRARVKKTRRSGG